MNEEQLLRAIGYMKYPEDTPVEERRGDPRCIVSHPDAFAEGHEGHTGPCGEPAVVEVWALPFCGRHGQEARLGAIQELVETTVNELEILHHAEAARFDANPLVRDVLAPARSLRHWRVDQEIYDMSARAAYPPDELAGNIDPDILRFEYGDYGTSTPPDWYQEELTLMYRFMRQSYEAGGLLHRRLEPLRESAVVQCLLAERDQEERWAAPERAARAAQRASS